MNIKVINLSFGLTKILCLLVSLLLLIVTACTTNTPSTLYPVPVPIQKNWLDINIYTDINKKITVSVGEEFIIGYSTGNNLLPIIKEVFDNSYITLLDKQTISPDGQEQRPGYRWFLFKALNTGETQITLQHFVHISEELIDERVFTVIIE